MARGSSPASATVATPSAEPPRAGFTTSGSPIRPTSAASTSDAPSSRNRLCGNETEVGTAMPARPTRSFAVGLSKARRQAAASAPT